MRYIFCKQGLNGMLMTVGTTDCIVCTHIIIRIKNVENKNKNKVLTFLPFAQKMKCFEFFNVK